MVWAISHDTKDSKYNKALAKVANRKILALPATDGSDEPYSFEDIANPQCKWTNCGEGCPKGGTVEVGSNNKYCKKSYQAACCTTDKKSMKLYTTCEWGEFPKCNSQVGCPGTDSTKDRLLASSPSGSGGAYCNMLAANPWDDDVWEVQSRKYCCDTGDTKASWGDCQWYGNIGLMPSGAPDKFCASGCPADRVRVAMDGLSKECYVGGAGGARSRCCLPNYSDTIEVENPKLDEYRSTLTAWLTAPECPNPGPVFDARRRQLMRTPGNGRNFDEYGGSNGTVSEDSENSVLADIFSRSDQPTINSAEAMLLGLLTSGTISSMLEAMSTIWNDEVADRFGGLRMPALRSYVTGLAEWLTEGPIQVVHGIICNPYYRNAYAGGSNTVTCAANYCSVEDCDDASEVESLLLGETTSVEESAETLKVPRAGVLDKRVARDYRPVLTDGTTTATIIITLPDYRGISELDENDPLQDETIEFAAQDDCGNARLVRSTLPSDQRLHMEHLFDGNVMGTFMQDAAAGRLRSGAVARSGPVAMSFFIAARTMPVALNAPPLPGGNDYDRTYARVMECLGSRENTASFVITEVRINQAKTKVSGFPICANPSLPVMYMNFDKAQNLKCAPADRRNIQLMQGMNPMDRDRLSRLAADANTPDEVSQRLRASLSFIEYMNFTGTPDANGRLTTIVNNVGKQWRLAQDVYNRIDIGSLPEIIEPFWFEWVQDFFGVFLINHTREFVQYGIDEMRKYWAIRTGDTADQVMAILRSQEAQLANISINTSGMK